MAENKIEFEIDPQTAQGHYSNFVIIAHSPSEVILDFASALPGMPKAKVGSRIILTPEHAKRLLLSLQENLHNYESKFGAIKLPQGGFKPNLS
ncbi:MAG: DUF3467 domain-containing protein [Alistipes sp.]|nr:DUF3467 domain-containing protein [Alistipes sp.]